MAFSPGVRRKGVLVILAITAAMAISAMVAGMRIQFRWGHNLYDLSLRVNEIHAIREQLNPIYVWNCSVESSKYRPAERPALPNEKEAPAQDPADPRKPVAYYPPWHTLLMWWYGFATPSQAGCVLAMVNGLAMFALAMFFRRFPVFRGEEGVYKAVFAWLLASVFVTYEFVWNLLTGNYATFAAGCSLLLVYALEKNRDALGAVAFSFLLVKPQIAVLFCWPLLFARKWKILFAAGAVAAAGTMSVAWWLDESPLALLRQIREVGLPFMGKTKFGHFFLLGEIFRIPFGRFGDVTATLSCFATCGILSYLMRNAKEWWLRILPAAMFFPYWTYSGFYDIPAAWPLFLAIPLLFFREKPLDCGVAASAVFRIATIGSVAFLFALRNGLVSGANLSRFLIPAAGAAAIATILLQNRRGTPQ